MIPPPSRPLAFQIEGGTGAGVSVSSVPVKGPRQGLFGLGASSMILGWGLQETQRGQYGLLKECSFNYVAISIMI